MSATLWIGLLGISDRTNASMSGAISWPRVQVSTMRSISARLATRSRSSEKRGSATSPSWPISAANRAKMRSFVQAIATHLPSRVG
jgi:hypothetical protein